MNNQKTNSVLIAFVLLLFAFVGVQAGATEVDNNVATTTEQPSKWKKAGEEVAEAAKAVGEASEESWDKTKDATGKSYKEMKAKGTEAWSKSKEKSGALIDETVKASGKAADSAKGKSKEAWKSTKEGSSELMDKAKSKVHEMTAPSPE